MQETSFVFDDDEEFIGSIIPEDEIESDYEPSERGTPDSVLLILKSN